MATSIFSSKTTCWRIAFFWLGWGFMSIGDPRKSHLGGNKVYKNWSYCHEILIFPAITYFKLSAAHKPQSIIQFVKGKLWPFFLHFRLFKSYIFQHKILPMTGFEKLTSGIGGNCSANWATTTALSYTILNSANKFKDFAIPKWEWWICLLFLTTNSYR